MASGISLDRVAALARLGADLWPPYGSRALVATDRNSSLGYAPAPSDPELTTGAGPALPWSLAADFNATGDFNGSLALAEDVDGGAPHTLLEVILISFVVFVLSAVTAGGNLMVIVSFKMDKQLQTVSNYFLLSLSVADFFIGLISMPLYTLYLVMDRWPLGPLICDAWLSMDYTMSNASVANLLVISFDRYLSVTKPLSYRARRTPRRAAVLISGAWIVSAALWTPWIVAWPYIEGERTVPAGRCEIQFLSTNQYITIITAVAAFYLPVVVMSVLYYRIYIETERRQKDLTRLQANRRTYGRQTRRQDSSDDDVYVNLRRTDSSPDAAVVDVDDDDDGSRAAGDVRSRRAGCWRRFTSVCRIDRDTDYLDDSSSSDPGSPHYVGCASSSSTSASVRGQLGSGSVRVRAAARDPHRIAGGKPQQNGKNHHHRQRDPDCVRPPLTIPLISVESTPSTPTVTPSTEVTGMSLSRHSNLSSVLGGARVGGSTSRTSELDRICEGDDPDGGGGRSGGRSSARSDPDMYTILIKLPDDGADPESKPSIRMISEEDETEDTDLGGDQSEGEHIPMECRSGGGGDRAPEGSPRTVRTGGDSLPAEFPSVGRRLTQSSDALRAAMQARIAMRLAQQAKVQRLKRKRQEKKQEKKAAKTLSAILLAFVITWTPYNIFTVINVFCVNCIHPTVYAIGRCTHRVGSASERSSSGDPWGPLVRGTGFLVASHGPGTINPVARLIRNPAVAELFRASSANCG
ncbi:hypothetical protein LSH36_210g07012 [Paralvinella palmiformis]|uniref:G-protein coupled receptors family 1 profile domain-containing protein n=1 Tax=Paralvinella palmiformis TaxID=53620 RepID=A0AAD9N5V3_9ANNE|nr:hypothetical protein LSH36_210g07012 [Paralvinella palmiformis]